MEERLRKKRNRILHTKTGSATSMQVSFNKFEYSNSYMWLEFYNAPLDKDIALISDTIRSWHILGRLGGYNSMNMQLSQAPLDKRPNYDAILGANIEPTTFYNIGDLEVQDNVARIWLDLSKLVLYSYHVKLVKQRERDSRNKQTLIERVERMVSWVPPNGNWYKLNTDGASRGNPGLATAGGVVRDGDGNWCCGFGLNIGICTAPLAELWGVYYGLYIAWERGITRLELEVDSEIVVGFLQKGIEDSHPLSFLVHLCYGFLSKDWIVRISHVYREANRLADGLANYAFSLSLGFHMFHSCPEDTRLLLFEDANGASHLRHVRL